jgi:hypothetical protein
VDTKSSISNIANAIQNCSDGILTVKRKKMKKKINKRKNNKKKKIFTFTPTCILYPSPAGIFSGKVLQLAFSPMRGNILTLNKVILQ